MSGTKNDAKGRRILRPIFILSFISQDTSEKISAEKYDPDIFFTYLGTNNVLMKILPIDDTNLLTNSFWDSSKSVIIGILYFALHGAMLSASIGQGV